MFESAIAQLERSATNCDIATPFLEAEGKEDEAQSSREKAADYRAAIQKLSVSAMERANFGSSEE